MDKDFLVSGWTFGQMDFNWSISVALAFTEAKDKDFRTISCVSVCHA